MNEVDELRGRVAELERYLDRYHEMLENRMQWQAERLVREVVTLLTLPAIALSLIGVTAFVQWLDLPTPLNWLASIVLIFATLLIVGTAFERFRESEQRRLPKPWEYIEKPQALKNYD